MAKISTRWWPPAFGFLSFAVLVPAAIAQEPRSAGQPAEEPIIETEGPSHAGLDEDGPDSLEEDFSELSIEELMNVSVVVTASRRPQNISDVPYAISVITAQDIRRSGARSIPDALRMAPGVDVADLSFGNAAVSPRGLHGFLANQTLVLVDGRQIFDSVFGGTLWGSWPFQLEDIERIEVIRGPGGVIWGANAVNGVINIITKDPADQLGLTITSGGGSRGTLKTHFGHAQQDGKLRLRISGEYEAGDGFDNGGSFLRKLDDDYKAGRISLHAVYEQGPDDTLTLSLGSAVLDGGYPPPPAGVLGRRVNPGSQASFIMANWAHKNAPDNHFDLTGYVNDFHMSNGTPSVDYRYQQLALQFGHTFKPADAHTLTWGIDGRVDLLDTTNADPFMLRRSVINSAIIGVYLQDEWALGPGWTLSLGGRADYDSYGGFEPSGRASLSRELTDHSAIYAAVSRAFGMPPAGARFLNTPLAGGLVRVTADRDIHASDLVAYELGYRGIFFDRLETSLNLYWHEYDHQATVSPRLGPPALLRIDYGHRGETSMYGLELDLRFEATRDLTLLGNYTYQDMDWRSSAPFHERDLISPPQNKAMLGVRYSPVEDLHLSSHLYYVDAVKAPNPANPFAPRRVNAYLRLDLLAEYSFWEDRASVALGVKNLLDSGHYEGGTFFINDAEVPRMVFAEFRIAIK